ncbi:unnamed protein product [Angiostrongylus costaricensis]|uniref:ABC transporter n=1 Tax=Angiostrongylus costaricensis TaxID=334426 RepID=A0A158PJ57_ANGCS|nr:unnamed protein product [Angiostrongylus costaricensis]
MTNGNRNDDNHNTLIKKLMDILLCRGDLAAEKRDRTPVSVLELFRFASKRDRYSMATGCVLALIVGSVLPVNCVLGGLYVNIYLTDANHYFLRLASRNIAKRIRKEFVMAVLRQNAAWFDKNCAGSITTQLNENISQIEDGIGDKMGMLARGISTLIACVTFALVSSWKITLVCVGVAPVSVITMAVMSRMSSSAMQGMMTVAGAAGALAEEAIMNVKTVSACNGQNHMIKKYQQQLKNGLPFAIRYGFICGFFEGLMFFQLYVFYAAAFLYGIPSYYHGITPEPGTIFITSSAILFGRPKIFARSSYFFGLLGPHMMAIEKARMAAAIIYETIDTEGGGSEDGEEMHSCEGRLEFKDVHFKYPSRWFHRRETPVLLGLSWFAEPGETVAFIGLLTRLYDCHKGSMFIDGRDIRTIKVRDLRKVRAHSIAALNEFRDRHLQMIGIVQQEPCLFNGTILENIVLGRPISDEQAKDAARMANAHDFIVKLEKGYDTVIGTGGVTLSGGQKQRLAIARAVATEPRILLLDEATSALDSESEKIVQLALNKASRGRTTVVIAHRLSTLKDVQRIYAIEGGKIVEEAVVYAYITKFVGNIAPNSTKYTGTHLELMESGGLYSSLAKAQEIGIGFGGWSAEAATSNIRVEVLRSLLSQNAEFFDRPHRSNAECVAELSSKAPDIQALCIEIFEHALTIQLLAVESYFLKKYEQYEMKVKTQRKRLVVYESIQFAITQCYLYFSDMVTYFIGAYMVFYGKAQAVETVVSAMSANLAGWAVIFASATFGDFVRSHFAAQSLYDLIDSCTKPEAGQTPVIQGSLKVEHVDFSYPSRPDVKVAKNLNLVARNGQAIALVGASGCGKSTVIQLLERFYEPDAGNIKIDDLVLNKICRVHLRNNIALVGQEPVLFKGSILENITLGIDEEISLTQVQEVCRQANAADFIEAFPSGYETNVGEKGSNLSGGQKQRIAIARALIRNPKIILLDEATSALDTESEKMVQKALNEASHGRTSLTIAHRLSTIKGADRIYYIENGSVIEYGTHEELIEANGKYALLVEAQQLGITETVHTLPFGPDKVCLQTLPTTNLFPSF